MAEPSLSIAVMPFRNLSPEPDTDYFARGFVEDLIANLTRFGALRVVASHTVFGWDGVDPAPDDVARAWDLQYVLEGSVRRRGSTLRVSTQLIRTADRHAVWAERFDAKLDDVFDVQDEITATVAGTMAVHLDDAQLERTRREPLHDLESYDCWLRGSDCLRRGTLEGDEESRPFFHRAPKVLRRLFERERGLLGLLSRCACDAVRCSFQAVLATTRALPGMVASIQTAGSFGNWHPHVHAIVTAGLVRRGGGFLPLVHIDAQVLEASFRRRVLERLHAAKRLSERFAEILLGWKHSGFSVFVGEPIEAQDQPALQRLSRYVARAPVALSKVFTEKGSERVRLLTPPDPATGKNVRVFDVLDWIHAVTTQIPDPGQHLQRYYGAYSNRARSLYRAADEGLTLPAEDGGETTGDEAGAVGARRAWARLLRRIYEVNPLVCPRCGTELQIMAVITDPDVVDRILHHRARRGLRSPFEPRAPPAA